MNNTREKRTQMNLKERAYMLLQETMTQPKGDLCQWRHKLQQQVEAKGNEKTYCSRVRPTEQSHESIGYTR